MRFKFLGGSNLIGSTSLLFETDNSTNIFDYGITPKNPPEYPLQAPPVDNIFLSHAHLDHSGMIPALTSKYNPNFFTTSITFELSSILLRDNLKICEIEGYPCLYTKRDIREMADFVIDIKFGLEYYLNDFDLIFHSAGHIPGSTMFQLLLRDGLNVLYTGDLNTIETRLVSPTKGIKCDVLIMETTYAGRNHIFRKKVEYLFQEKVKEILERDGKVIIPAFAVGRTQEVLLILADLDVEIWLDGLGGDVTRLLLKYPHFIKNEKKLKKLFEKIHRIRTDSQRKKALNGEVIVTTSGMLDGGPVHKYIKELNNNQKNGLLLTGYQVEGSNGRLLLDEGKMNLYGKMEKINMEVDFFDFSAHAGHKELINFAKKCDPEHIILYHGEDRNLLVQELEDSHKIHLPNDGKVFNI